MSDPNEAGARSLFGLRKRAPKRPISVTIVLALVLTFLFLSGPRQLTQESAVQQARAFVMSELARRCGTVSEISEGRISRIASGSGELERYEVELIARVAGDQEVAVSLQVWPGIRIGPRIPTGSGNAFALFEFEDGVELVDNELHC